MANGVLVPSLGCWQGPIELGDSKIHAAFEIFPSGGHWSFLCGKPLLQAFGASHNYTDDTISIPNAKHPTTILNSYLRPTSNISRIPTLDHKTNSPTPTWAPQAEAAAAPPTPLSVPPESTPGVTDHPSTAETWQIGPDVPSTDDDPGVEIPPMAPPTPHKYLYACYGAFQTRTCTSHSRRCLHRTRHHRRATHAGDGLSPRIRRLFCVIHERSKTHSWCRAQAESAARCYVSAKSSPKELYTATAGVHSQAHRRDARGRRH